MGPNREPLFLQRCWITSKFLISYVCLITVVGFNVIARSFKMCWHLNQLWHTVSALRAVCHWGVTVNQSFLSAGPSPQWDQQSGSLSEGNCLMKEHISLLHICKQYFIIVVWFKVQQQPLWPDTFYYNKLIRAAQPNDVQNHSCIFLRSTLNGYRGNRKKSYLFSCSSKVTLLKSHPVVCI